MMFDILHERYKSSCEEALSAVCKQYFMQNSQVSKAAEYALMNGGKRVRGVLVLAVCDMLGGDITIAKEAAAAIEMIHAFSLVHDDLPCMDDDDMRRGKPSCHVAFGENTALLAGDALSIGAFEVLANALNLSPSQKCAAISVLAKASGAKGMIYGQELDLENENKHADAVVLRNIQRYKTGALIVAAAHLGVVCAGENVDNHVDVTTYAENLGVVFQMVDDILDVCASQEELGKPIGSDEKQGKHTMVRVYGIEKTREMAEELTNKAIQTLNARYAEKSLYLSEYAQNLLKRAF